MLVPNGIYNMKLAIVGDFSRYGCKSLRDFIYKCIQCKIVFFVNNKQDALEALHRVG
ncbi:DUF4180 domain-containing protein [Paenibacillus sp. D2_2]|uniref:DUF4180 domain-containing protein n=1 Tax=Paenibacillus sp. D2_2 TaxID=3073092 RepID=UPI002814BD94|nr:DUF4180 domain-containing protein [Paenibacillus sp. D2_2]WMT41634.1 DUF4180 domain-containing protein [Paenibacillus sp. D2_2]